MKRPAATILMSSANRPARTAFLFAPLLFFASSLAMPQVALADSCWNHNGSIMRLKASGNQRWLYYENPRQVLWNAGVRPGTLFFNGVKDGNYYSGTARRFSKFCPGTPLEYYVGGPVAPNQLRITLEGNYVVHRQCRSTGQQKFDSLVFTYSHDC